MATSEEGREYRLEEMRIIREKLNASKELTDDEIAKLRERLSELYREVQALR